MAMRVCSEPGCPTLVTEAGRCVEHRRVQERRRGSRQARGYDVEHDRLRATWQPVVEAGTVNCARCGALIRIGEPWDLGHNDDDRTKYNGPEHRTCNRAAGGRAAHPTHTRST